MSLSEYEKRLMNTYRGLYAPAVSPTLKLGQKVYWRTGKSRGKFAGEIIEVRAGGSALLLSSQGVGRAPTMRSIGKRHYTFAILGEEGLTFGASKDITTKTSRRHKRRR